MSERVHLYGVATLSQNGPPRSHQGGKPEANYCNNHYMLAGKQVLVLDRACSRQP